MMGINAASNNISPKSGASSGQPAWDSHETSIRNEIKAKQEEVKQISKNDKLSAEQKARQKQALQEEIQSLNSELRQYQIQKRQEEVREKQQSAKPESQKSNSEKSDNSSTEEGKRVFGDERLGVIISISLSQAQVTNLEKVRKDLEGKQRTAGTDDEKETLQKKIDNVSKDIGKKIVITEDSIQKAQKEEKSGNGQNQGKGEDLGIGDKASNITKLFDKPDNRNTPFEDVSVIFG